MEIGREQHSVLRILSVNGIEAVKSELKIKQNTEESVLQQSLSIAAIALLLI